ncbi:hypothetical protein OSB04_019372 [Centaurea solstitialis]|uniref:Uncharacterized protein n=1 Tax=Centaurea solstitialis TaxID=347529 RepID=A0AA38WE69_9ASTR|nr:hypothetical protein OSB04_019372 [Centaurea solstitialis]
MTYNDVKLRITLWGKLAKNYKDDKIIVILTSCKVRVFKGVPCLMTMVASQLYFNLQQDIVASYKDIEATLVSFQSDQSEKMGTSYTIDVVIIGIDMFNDWKFVLLGFCDSDKTDINI